MKLSPLKVRTVTVSSKGQFTIPQDHRKRLGIQPGDKGLSYQIGNFVCSGTFSYKTSNLLYAKQHIAAPVLLGQRAGQSAPAL
jgi:hypothetical protein